MSPSRPAGPALAAAAALLALSGPAHAAGFYIQEQSVEGLGRAYSGEASDTGANKLWWNPASIADIDHGELDLGLQAIQVFANVNDAGSTIQRPGQPATGVGGTSSVKNPVPNGYVPDFDAALRLNREWSVGLAVSAPFDFVSKYTDADWTRYQALTSRLFDLDVQPTLAWRPTPWLNLGAGFDAQYLDARLTSALPNLSPLLPDGSSSLKGDGWDYGWNVGAQVKPVGGLTVGASYRSAIKHHLDGQVAASGLLGPAAAGNFSTSGSAAFTTPWIATLGARWRVNDRLALDAQVQEFGWSEFSAITVSYGGGGTVMPQNYHDTTTEAVGAEYALSPRLTLRGGVQHDPTPTPDVGRSARVPDGDRWIYAMGASYQANPRMTFDVGASWIDFAHSQINADATAFAGTPLVTPISLTGDVTGNALVLSAGVRAKF